MKKSLIIGMAVASVAAAVSSLISVGVSAGPLREANDRTIPARQIIADAFQPSFGASPRIIHIPQPDDAQAEVDYRDNAGAPDTDNGYEPPAHIERQPPVRQVRPAPRPRSEAPRVKRHIVTSAPPPPPHADEMDNGKDKALTPLYPTPAFGTSANGGEKFDPPPRESDASPSSPRLE